MERSYFLTASGQNMIEHVALFFSQMKLVCHKRFVKIVGVLFKTDLRSVGRYTKPHKNQPSFQGIARDEAKRARTGAACVFSCGRLGWLPLIGSMSVRLSGFVETTGQKRKP